MCEDDRVALRRDQTGSGQGATAGQKLQCALWIRPGSKRVNCRARRNYSTIAPAHVTVARFNEADDRKLYKRKKHYKERSMVSVKHNIGKVL